MPRDHVEFVQSQALPWRPAASLLERSGAAFKLLSRDAASGAMSTLLRYPPGWALADAGRLLVDEELYVLEGTLEIGELCYREGDYAFLPAGYRRRGMRSETGSIVLTFFEGTPDGSASFDARRLVEHVATRDAAWVGASDAVIASERVRRLVLKPDGIDGDRTWILHMDATEDEPFEVNGIERHPCVEEMFLLEGDFVMACGRMTPGAYFWRPPMIPHGPMGTQHGFTGLFRAKEGTFSTHWSAADGPIDWDAAYRPTLPETMRQRLIEAGANDSAW